jgi:hypothetical protein
MKQLLQRPHARLLLLFLCSLFLLNAGRASAQRSERIHTIKVGYLTDRLKLSTDQASSFWPVYDAYEAELRNTRKTFRRSQRDAQAPANDAEARRVIDDNLEYQEAVLGINKRYRDRFLKVITPTQLATLYEAERDFRKMLLQQLRERKDGGN